jgi:hypothetical protein
LDPKKSTCDHRYGPGGQDKALLMWVRQKNMARHTNQGKGSSNASACAALITVVLFMANEFCHSLS